MTHRERYRIACQKAFEGFQPNLHGCRNPSEVLLVRDLAADGCLSAEIANRIGKTSKAVQKIFRRYNFPRLHNIAPPLREERLGWKGGVKIVKGYKYQRTPKHPLASKHGQYVAVHRLVMEETLGRYLLATEVVDHIDGNTMNNHPDNLRVFASNADHLRVTLAGRCPKWSDDGRRRISEAVKKRHQMRRDAATEPNPAE
jgi:hypothetical protein